MLYFYSQSMVSIKMSALQISACLTNSEDFANSSNITNPDVDSLINGVVHDRSSSIELFPDGYFIASWEPYRIMASNFKEVYPENDIAWTWADECSKPTMISIRTVYQCRMGLSLDVEIYGSGDQNVQMHLLDALRYLVACCPEYKEDVAVQIFTPLDIEVDLTILKEASWAPSPHTQTYLILQKRLYQ